MLGTPMQTGRPNGVRSSDWLGVSCRFMDALNDEFEEVVGFGCNARKIEGDWRKSKSSVGVGEGAFHGVRSLQVEFAVSKF